MHEAVELFSDEYFISGEKFINVLGDPMPVKDLIDALKCEKCGYDNYTFGKAERDCSEGNCLEFYCKNCGYSNSSMGPVGCECQSKKAKAARNDQKIQRQLRIRNRRAARRKSVKKI